jgi:hypothetical protein
LRLRIAEWHRPSESAIAFRLWTATLYPVEIAVGQKFWRTTRRDLQRKVRQPGVGQRREAGADAAMSHQRLRRGREDAYQHVAADDACRVLPEGRHREKIAAEVEKAVLGIIEEAK